MPNTRTGKRFYEFGPFRLDCASRVLFRNGSVVALTPKALDTLQVLLENAGKPVEKETLVKAVWPDAFVEESNLAHNISVLRKALENGPATGPYIETLSKRGYRFVGVVREAWEEVSSEAPPPAVRAQVRRWLLAMAVLTVALVALMVGASLGWFTRSLDRLPELIQRQLTANPTDEDPVFRAAISPDGKYLAYTNLSGVHLLLIDRGETRPYLFRRPSASGEWICPGSRMGPGCWRAGWAVPRTSRGSGRSPP
jgi:DNA-binding winged helix-turn-helix (wHTH) protein